MSHEWSSVLGMVDKRRLTEDTEFRRLLAELERERELNRRLADRVRLKEDDWLGARSGPPWWVWYLAVTFAALLFGGPVARTIGLGNEWHRFTFAAGQALANLLALAVVGALAWLWLKSKLGLKK